MYTFGRLGVVPAKRKECISVLMCGAHKGKPGETRGNQGNETWEQTIKNISTSTTLLTLQSLIV